MIENIHNLKIQRDLHCQIIVRFKKKFFYIYKKNTSQKPTLETTIPRKKHQFQDFSISKEMVYS